MESLSEQVRREIDQQVMDEILEDLQRRTPCPDCAGIGLPCQGPHGAD